MTTVNIPLLKETAAKDPKVKALFELYGKRLRGRQDSTVPRARRVLQDAGIDMSTKELTAFYGTMQKAHAGRWVSGRHGKSGRFVWGFHLKSIADAVNGFEYVYDAKTKTYSTKPIEVVSLKPAAKPRVKLPRYTQAGHRNPLLASAKPRLVSMPVSLMPEPIASPMPASSRAIKVKRAGFEIELPINMSEQERKDAAVFLTALDQAV